MTNANKGKETKTSRAPSSKKSRPQKKITTGKKTASRKDKVAANRGNATSSREELVSQLR